MSCFSALVKLLNKSIEGTADDEEEGVTPDTAIRAGLELLKVQDMDKHILSWHLIVHTWFFLPLILACYSLCVAWFL